MHPGSPTLAVEGKGTLQEGSGARRMDKAACEPWFSRTGPGTAGTPARARRCTVQARVGACGCGGTARTCSSRAAFGSRSGSEWSKKKKKNMVVLLLLVLLMMMMGNWWLWYCLCLMSQILERNS